ncbi:hypothetical protein D3C84_356820 [compost metagenome]
MRSHPLYGNSHGNQSPPSGHFSRVCDITEQSLGHAHHRRGGAGAFDQRPDSVRAAVDLSDAQGQLWPDLHPGRPDYLDLPAHRLAVAAVGRLLHRSPPQALSAANGHDLHPDRYSDDVSGRQFSVDPAGGGADRHRLLDLSPGSFPCGATGLGRALRSGAVDLPGRWQRRFSVRAVAGGGDHHSVRPG